MAYADFTYYQETYLGRVVVDSATFNRLSIRVQAKLDNLSFGRIDPIIEDGTDTETIEKINLALCAAIDEMSLLENNNGRVISSESVGDHSVSYVNDETTKLPGKKVEGVIREFLGNTGLLFAGFYDGEYGGVVDEN